MFIEDHLVNVEEVGSDACWRLPNKPRKDGYVHIRVDGEHVYAHRAIYENLVGPIPKAKPQLDHLCRHRWCCNPNHVEPVTNVVNVRRGAASTVNAARQRAKTHCPSGHPYSGDNLHIMPDGHRRCRTCRRESVRMAQAKAKMKG